MANRAILVSILHAFRKILNVVRVVAVLYYNPQSWYLNTITNIYHCEYLRVENYNIIIVN